MTSSSSVFLVIFAASSCRRLRPALRLHFSYCCSVSLATLKCCSHRAELSPSPLCLVLHRICSCYSCLCSVQFVRASSICSPSLFALCGLVVAVTRVSLVSSLRTCQCCPCLQLAVLTSSCNSRVLHMSACAFCLVPALAARHCPRIPPGTASPMLVLHAACRRV